jgi:hypothetical protein
MFEKLIIQIEIYFKITLIEKKKAKKILTIIIHNFVNLSSGTIWTIQMVCCV